MIGRRLFEASPDALALEKTIGWNHQRWKIVGVFESNGDRRESQIIGDQINLRAAYNESEYSDIYVRLKDKDGLHEITDMLEKRFGSNIVAQSERELLGRAGGTIKFIMLIIGSITVGLMAVGAVIGGVNIISMLVADKTREIGMLKALGFRKSFIFIGVLGESLAISLPSAAIAFLIARIIMQGKIISTSTNGGLLISFDLNFDAFIFLSIMEFSFLLGLFGGLVPASRAVSIRPIDAMNSIE